jgi:hypothetical protein
MNNIDSWLLRTKHYSRISPGHSQSEIRGDLFDELVVGKWIHIEQLSERCWYIGLHEGLQLYVYVTEAGVERIEVGTDDLLQKFLIDKKDEFTKIKEGLGRHDPLDSGYVLRLFKEQEEQIQEQKKQIERLTLELEEYYNKNTKE